MVSEVKEGSELDGTSLHHLCASKALMLPAHRDIQILVSNCSNDTVHKWAAQVKGPVSLNLDTYNAQPHHHQELLAPTDKGRRSHKWEESFLFITPRKGWEKHRKLMN